MGSSAKKKKDKKKDFQKPKLKVGKARPKPANFTDTSFKSKAIVLNQQSITTAAPSATSQFAHHISLLTSRTDSQRRDSLSYLTTAIATRPTNAPLPQPVSVLLPRLLPLTLDISNGVRSQLLKLLRALPPRDIEDHIGNVILWIRAGVTNLAAEIRSSTMDMLAWALDCAGDALVSCAGGWVKTLKALIIMQGWPMESSPQAWSSTKTTFGKPGSDGKALAKSLTTMAAFLEAGLQDRRQEQGMQLMNWGWPLNHVEQHMISQRSNCFAYLNLFGPPPDEESQIYEDRGDRQRVFANRFQKPIKLGLEAAKQGGGDVGRASARVQKAIKDGMKDFDGLD
ncbi:MAG: hypothetical protein LQ349_000560 [Xanthoria aureola]|nr:MAG: hypothetical protein LQ349_000560 [Xanthoria aureola]